MKWSLYENSKFLAPLKFSNNKTQEDIVKEVVDAVAKGVRVIFIHGVCGTGKSAIALNVARNLGQTSIVVPIKNLQNQYKKDYEKRKYLLKENGEKLKISVMTGRKNHKCKFLEENKGAIPVIKKEINSKLHDIFAGKKKEIDEVIGQDISADNYNIPCKIEIREKNWNKIKQYLKQNKRVHVRDFLEIKDVKRMSIAGACPYWSPVLPEKYELKDFGKRKSYQGLGGMKYNFYQRKPGCAFYEQFNSYINSDVIIFNSLKYKLESSLGRKPMTEVEIIDECDEFLDSFANQRRINLERLQRTMASTPDYDEFRKVKKELLAILAHIKRDSRIGEAVNSEGILHLKETGVYDLLKIILSSGEFLENVDEENYLLQAEETARLFDEFFDETYVTFHKKEGDLIVSLVTTNLEKKFKEMVEKNKVVVLMSGTLHSDEVLESVFGIKNFVKIDAEKEQQGQINVCRTGLEMDCKYANFANGRLRRENYLKAFDKSVELAEKPVLVHVNAFSDLPTEQEIQELNLGNLISREKLREMQHNDDGELVREFKKGGEEVLFSTRCGRGIDFPGEECNSVVFTKYPNPDVKDVFWKILMKTQPQNYWGFYRDKARRELLQKVYRGLRSKNDKINLLSPDLRVIEFFEKLYK